MQRTKGICTNPIKNYYEEKEENKTWEMTEILKKKRNNIGSGKGDPVNL